MATDQQLAANRRNATRSTGPRTGSGKASSSKNALKSGYAKSLVIPGEDPDALDRLRAEYAEEFQPQTPTERDLVDTLVHTEWLRRRIRVVESAAWNDYFARDRACCERENLPYDETFALGRIFDYAGPRLEAIRRRLSGLDRTYHTTLADLRKFQAERARAAQPAAARKPAVIATEASDWVRSNIPTAAANTATPTASVRPHDPRLALRL